MSIAPGFMTMKGARDVLEAADRALPPDNLVSRSLVLAHLAWTAPHCFDAELVGPLVARAEALARASHESSALAVALSAKLYFANGPDSRDLAETISKQIDLLYAESSPLVRVYWSAQRKFSRIVVSLQQGDSAAIEDSIAAFGAAARELRHPQLEWHHRRAGVVHRMNRGDYCGLEAAVRELHLAAEELHLFSLQEVRALDRIILRRETDSMPAPPSFTDALVVHEGDCPYRRARKIRSLAELGAVDVARAELHDLAPSALGRLPHDRDFLATLVHLSVASIATSQPRACRSALRAAVALSALVCRRPQLALRRVGVALSRHARPGARSHGGGHEASRRGDRGERPRGLRAPGCPLGLRARPSAVQYGRHASRQARTRATDTSARRDAPDRHAAAGARRAEAAR